MYCLKYTCFVALMGLCLFASVAIMAQSNIDPVRPHADVISTDLRLAGAVTVFERGDEVRLILELVNTAGVPMEMWTPDLAQRTVSLNVFRDGVVIQPQVRWSSPFRPQSMTLTADERQEIVLELSRLFPLALPAGDYEVEAVILAAEDVEIRTGSIHFEIQPMPADVQSEYDEYRRAIGGGEHIDVIEMGYAFLEKYSDSKFADNLCLELGLALIGLKRYDEAITVYNRALESDGSAEWQRTEARWRIAWSHHDRGELQAAIHAMKQVNTREARKYEHQWQTQADAEK